MHNHHFYLKKLIILLAFCCISLELNAKDFDPVTQDPVNIDAHFPPAFYEIFIPIENVKMTGFILTANGQGPHPTVVLMHGLPGNEKNLDLAQSLRRAGFNVLFFHYRGSWGSEGNYSFLQLHQDALAVLSFLRKNSHKYRVDIHHLTIMGHSFGGYTALRAGSIDKNVACVVAISAANPGLIASSHRDTKHHESSQFSQYIDQLIMLRNFPGTQAISEIKQHGKEMDTRNYGQGLKNKKVLLIGGNNDTTVPISTQKEVYANYHKIKGLDVTNDIIPGDHAFSISRFQLQHHVVSWLENHCR